MVIHPPFYSPFQINVSGWYQGWFLFYYFFLCAFYTSNFSASNKYIFIIREIIIKVITGIKIRVLGKKKRENYKHLSPTTPLSHSTNICSVPTSRLDTGERGMSWPVSLFSGITIHNILGWFFCLWSLFHIGFYLILLAKSKQAWHWNYLH